MYVVRSASLVWPKSGLSLALMVAVEAVPPPHWVEQPSVVGVTVAAFVTTPAPVTTPVTV
jgi:hypothetical protein